MGCKPSKDKPQAQEMALTQQQQAVAPLDPDVKGLLVRAGLAERAELFARERITYSALTKLTDADMKELGLAVGERVQLRDQLASLVQVCAFVSSRDIMDRAPPAHTPRSSSQWPQRTSGWTSPRVPTQRCARPRSPAGR